MNQKIDFAILGFGQTGDALCAHLLQEGHKVTVIDQQEQSHLSHRSQKYQDTSNFTLIAPIKEPIDLDQFDHVIPSPGFRIKPELFKGSLNNIISELDYCMPLFKNCHIIAVTGTNGKTTSVKLLTHLLQQQGKRVFLGGNVGIPMVNILNDQYDTVILELSSFQLQYSHNYRFDTGIIMNIADDHLTWHSSRTEYLEAKLALLEHTTGIRYCHNSIKNYTKVHRIKTKIPDNITWFGPREQNKLENNIIKLGQKQYSLSTLNRDKAIFGENLIPLYHHFLKDFSENDLISGINRFVPEQFRLNLEIHRKITFINDSKSTNIDSVCFGIKGFPGSILILSGDDKGLDYAPCLEACHTHHIKQVVGFGVMGEKLIDYFPKQFNYQNFCDLEPLLHYLKERLIPGDTVLFSPGSSSFDRYKNYIHRGESFNELVNQIFGGV